MKTTTKTFVSVTLLAAGVALAEEVWNRSTTQGNVGEYVYPATPSLSADSTVVPSSEGNLSTQPWVTASDPHGGSTTSLDHVRSEGGLVLFSFGSEK